MIKKLNTKLFSSGAEFLVLSKLLLAGIETYKAYENQKDNVFFKKLFFSVILAP
ncbi:hypothetical protein N9I24_02115 [Gammaproteobacteria bacterium]|nr:hypothetical protein [Gammaproteobacteria bacterium]